MSDVEVFILADRALQRVVEQIHDDQWDMVMPPEFARRGTDSVTLREIINYHAQDDAWVPDMLIGKTMDEVGKDTYAGDLLGEDPKASFAKYVDLACAAAERVTDPEQTVHCSFGDYTTQHYLWQITSFRGLRVHDIAVVIGIDRKLPDDLVQGLWDELSPVADEWRTYGVYKAAVPVPENASLQNKLLGLTGRQPD